MTNVITIAKQGVNATTATNPNDFVFHSGYNTFKILAQGKLVNQLVNADPKVFSVTHNLDYVPNFYAFCKFPDGKVSLAGPLSGNFQGTSSSPGAVLGYFTPEADSSKLYFELTRNGSNYTVSIKYYIFEATL